LKENKRVRGEIAPGQRKRKGGQPVVEGIYRRSKHGFGKGNNTELGGGWNYLAHCLILKTKSRGRLRRLDGAEKKREEGIRTPCACNGERKKG